MTVRTNLEPQVNGRHSGGGTLQMREHALASNPARDAVVNPLRRYCGRHVHAYERHNRVYDYQVNRCAPSYVTIGAP